MTAKDPSSNFGSATQNAVKPSQTTADSKKAIATRSIRERKVKSIENICLGLKRLQNDYRTCIGHFTESVRKNNTSGRRKLFFNVTLSQPLPQKSNRSGRKTCRTGKKIVSEYVIFWQRAKSGDQIRRRWFYRPGRRRRNRSRNARRIPSGRLPVCRKR